MPLRYYLEMGQQMRSEIVRAAHHLMRQNGESIVVGSTALWLRGMTAAEPNDLDIVVRSLDGIPGDLTAYETDSPFSISGKRAFSLLPDGVKMDIFVEDRIPDFEIIKGIRIQTVASMLRHYQELLPRAKDHWKNGILKKINTLQNG